MHSSALHKLKYLFDLNGYVVVRNVLSKEELQAANRAIDSHVFSTRLRPEVRNATEESPYAGEKQKGRMDMAGMLGWAKDEREVFRNCLAHPKLVPVLHAILGKGYRLDHSPLVIAQERGSEGFNLHGGPISASNEFRPELQYRCEKDRIYTSLLGVSVQLSGQQAGDGGYCVVNGSHKIGFAPPKDCMDGSDAQFMMDFVQQPVTNPGDVILFSEATIHGCLPWTSPKQRRIVLYRFAPSTHAFARGYSDPIWPESYTSGMTPEQLAVMQPPYNTIYDRELLDDSGSISKNKYCRSKAKKDFDLEVFKTHYY